MIAMRWAIRSAGLVSTVILARVLTPEDFGVVAMSSLVYGLLQMCSEMGTSQLLLRTRETDPSAYNTAWTISLIQSIVVAVMVFFVAFPAATFFSEPRVTAVMQIAAAGGVLNGFINNGIVMFRRDLDFRRDFMYGFCAKVVTVIPTVILALVYRNYWALVIGPIIGHGFEVLISYVMHPFRPRLSVADWRRFVRFSLWITPSTIANFLSRKTDVFVVGYIASTAQLGAYNVASELSRMATAEVVGPMARAIYPNYAKLKNDLNELSAAFLMVLRTVCIISFSFGFGIAAVAEDVVFVVLGDQWGFAAPLVAWLGVFGTFSAILITLTGHILIVLERERVMFFTNWIKLGVFASSVLVASLTGDVVTVAMAAALSTAVFTVAFTFYFPRMLPVSAARLLSQMYPMLIIALAMFLAVKLTHSYAIPSRFVTLIIDASTGAAVFVALLYLLWIAAGRPDGSEQRLLSLVSAYLRKSVHRH